MSVEMTPNLKNQNRITLTPSPQKENSLLSLFYFFDTYNLKPNKIPIGDSKILSNFLWNVDSSLVCYSNNELHGLLQNNLTLIHNTTSGIFTDCVYKKVSIPTKCIFLPYCIQSYPQHLYLVGMLGYNRIHNIGDALWQPN